VKLEFCGPLALIGPNGSGKTTFLRAIVGAANLDGGAIHLGDETLVDADSKVFQQPEKRRVGYLPQGFGLFPHMTVAQNVAYGLSYGPGKVAAAERHQRVDSILKRLECERIADRNASRLSGGEQQRVALARALVVEPELLLLDEPLSSLDAVARRSIRGVLVDLLGAFDGPSIWVTHDVRDVAALDAPIAVLSRGELVTTGRLVELKSAPPNPFVAEFVDA
jgi:ABC-type sulfate/molybdate transport systems ATPase subunit